MHVEAGVSRPASLGQTVSAVEWKEMGGGPVLALKIGALIG